MRDNDVKSEEGAEAKATKRRMSAFRKKGLTIRLARLGVQGVFLALSVFSLIYLNFTWVAAIMAISFLGGAWFCGWACPFGAAQDWLGRLGRLIFKKRLRVPYRVERFLSLLRYPLLALSLAGFAYTAFLSRPYQNFMGLIAGHTAYVGIAAWCLMGAFLAASLALDRPFCRYFCLEGASYGLLSLGRIFTIQREGEKCMGCGACDRACPSGIRVSAHPQVRHPACVNCLECLASCPAASCLKYAFFLKKGKKQSEENEGVKR